MANIYCVKCRAKTSNANEPKRQLARNNRHMLVTKCKACGTKKVQFTK